MTFSTRFAPSPTGPLHLGHAYSALTAYNMALENNGVFHLRMDDLDQSRSRRHWENQIFEDLSWLGIKWPEPVWRQSERMAKYRSALQTLWNRGLIYPCHCSRADIINAINAPQEQDPQIGPDGMIYPGTCRPQKPLKGPLPNISLRIDMRKALKCHSRGLYFTETGMGPNGKTGLVKIRNMVENAGDVALARAQIGASYHLSIVIDDAEQGITHIARGRDLFEATQIHVLLQRLLDLPTPVYHHHKLIRDKTGRRLAKRDDARAISKYREEGKTPQDIRCMIGL
ncbi:MAG: tRNA glutamyl-Q(34) synthetase GluQRS [Roseovarius sp.]|nr:tRNA glutamyl-Q(34) synthetase GluQRS [Roseovarius sp.]